MRTRDDVERYLALTGHPYEAVAPDTWAVLLPPKLRLVARLQGPILVMQMNVMPVPERDREEFFATLLRLNATRVVHGAFGLEDGRVVLACALEVENLDQNELQAAVDSFELTMADSKETLARWA